MRATYATSGTWHRHLVHFMDIGIFCVTVAGALLVSVVLPLLGSALSAFPASRLVGYITSPIRAVCGAVIRATGSVLRVT